MFVPANLGENSSLNELSSYEPTSAVNFAFLNGNKGGKDRDPRKLIASGREYFALG